MAGTPARKALIEQALDEYRRRLETELPDDAATLDEIESAVAKIQREISRDLQRRLVEERKQSARDNRVPCPCGAHARYRDEQRRCLITRHGELVFLRPYYYCHACQTGFAPFDRTLGLDAGNTTTQVRLWLAQLAALEPFVPAASLLVTLTGVQVSASTVERTAVTIGTALGAHHQQQAALHQLGRLPEPELIPKRLYISMDGAMAPLREAWRKDGKAGELALRYGECKTGVVYEAVPGPKGDAGVRCKAYVATLEGVERFGPQIGRLAHEHGHHRAKETLVLGDGALWIWQVSARQFPGAIEIVDFYHATQHLYLLANAHFGAESEAGRGWVAARQAELKADDVRAVLRAIAAWKPKSREQYPLRRTQFRYFRHNAERMRYGTFRKKGYHIGSGVVEAGCRQVVCQRLDEAGMHWREENAEAIVTLRAAFLSTHTPDLRPYCAMPH
jgi:hypothetical protein